VQMLEGICASHGLDPTKYALKTFDTPPVLLNPEATFASCGLGDKLHKLTLRVEATEKTEIVGVNYPPEFASLERFATLRINQGSALAEQLGHLQSVERQKKELELEKTKIQAELNVEKGEKEKLTIALSGAQSTSQKEKEYYEKQIKQLETSFQESVKIGEHHRRGSVIGLFQPTQEGKPTGKEDPVTMQLALKGVENENERLKIDLEHNKSMFDSELDTIKKEVQYYKDKEAEMSQQIKNFNDDKQKLTSELEQLKKLIEQEKETNASLQKVVDQNKALGDISKLKEDLTQDYEQKLKEIGEQHQAMFHELEEQVQSLTSALKMTKMEKDLSTQRLQETDTANQSRIKKLTETITSLETELAQLKGAAPSQQKPEEPKVSSETPSPITTDQKESVEQSEPSLKPSDTEPKTDIQQAPPSESTETKEPPKEEKKQEVVDNSEKLRELEQLIQTQREEKELQEKQKKELEDYLKAQSEENEKQKTELKSAYQLQQTEKETHKKEMENLIKLQQAEKEKQQKEMEAAQNKLRLERAEFEKLKLSMGVVTEVEDVASKEAALEIAHPILIKLPPPPPPSDFAKPKEPEPQVKKVEEPDKPSKKVTLGAQPAGLGGASLLLQLKTVSLKKSEIQSPKKSEDDLVNALQKRFMSIHMEDIEDLDELSEIASDEDEDFDEDDDEEDLSNIVYDSLHL